MEITPQQALVSKTVESHEKRDSLCWYGGVYACNVSTWEAEAGGQPAV